MNKNNYNMFFDFDGVLLDSLGLKTEAFKTLFTVYGDNIVSQVLAHHRQHGGISRIDKIQYAHEHFVGAPLSDQELKEWNRRFSDLVVDRVINASWVGGAKEFLERNYEDSLIFVISGTPEDELKQVISKRNISRYFKEILGSPTRKPDHIRYLLAKYRLDPASCVFVGDALTDYYAARETGLHFIGIQGEVTFPDGTMVLPDCTGLESAIHALYQSGVS